MAIKKLDEQKNGRNVYVEDGIEFDRFFDVSFGDVPGVRLYELIESPSISIYRTIPYANAYIVTKKRAGSKAFKNLTMEVAKAEGAPSMDWYFLANGKSGRFNGYKHVGFFM